MAIDVELIHAAFGLKRSLKRARLSRADVAALVMRVEPDAALVFSTPYDFDLFVFVVVVAVLMCVHI
jgi:hypothetical protein